jgi:transcriptional regulator with XRE-family HTH domain
MPITPSTHAARTGAEAPPQPSAAAARDGLCATLKAARRARGISQLELALRVGVSQRHLSCVETGRARPSQTLLMACLQALDAPLAVRNSALLQAGYAPAFHAATLAGHELQLARAALEQLLRAHDPMPALLLDAHWNVLQRNQGAQRLWRWLLPDIEETPDEQQVVNLLDGLVHPQGFGRRILNLAEVGPALWLQLRNEACALPALTPRVETLEAFLRQHLARRQLTALESPEQLPRPTPMLTTRFDTPVGELAFFSMFTTFGSPQDITLASMRVEHLCAADAATEQAMRALQR